MTDQDKARCREEISKGGWHKVGQIEPEPSIMLWNTDKEVRIIYENMDGKPCMCNAVVVHSSCGFTYFKATNGDAKGNKMSGVIAYREIDKPLKDADESLLIKYETEHREKTLQRWTKAELVHHIQCIEHNNNVLYERINNQCRYLESMRKENEI